MLALLGVVLGLIFVIGLLRIKPLPELLLATPKRNYKALSAPPTPLLRPGQKLLRSAHRQTDLKPSDVPLNSGEGLRAAYYVDYDPASYSSLKQHIHQIDLLFPDWLHVVTPDGALTSYSARQPAVCGGRWRRGVMGSTTRIRLRARLRRRGEDTEIFPLVNNYDPVKQYMAAGGGRFSAERRRRARTS